MTESHTESTAVAAASAASPASPPEPAKPAQQSSVADQLAAHDPDASERLPALAQDIASLLRLAGNDPGVFQPYAELHHSLNASIAGVDEFSALLQSLKATAEATADTVLPQLVARAKDTEDVFRAIDRVERLVAAVELSVSQLEQKLEQVERVYGSNKLKSFVSSFFRRAPAVERLEWTPTRIPRAGDFFEPDPDAQPR